MRCRARPVVAAVAILLLVTAGPGRAGAQAPEPPPPMDHALVKVLTYEAATNLADVLFYTLVLGGTLAGAGLFTAANVLAAAVTYHAVELAWTVPDPAPGSALVEGGPPPFDKTVTYRALNVARNVALGLAFTVSPLATFGFALVSSVTDAVVYAGNELAWDAHHPPVHEAGDEDFTAYRFDPVLEAALAL